MFWDLLLWWVGLSAVVTAALLLRWQWDARRDRDITRRLDAYLAPLRADAQVAALDELFYAPAFGETT